MPEHNATPDLRGRGDGVTALTASDIQHRLLARYRAPEWASFVELRDATGFAHQRAIDFFAVNTYPSKGLLTLAAEVKVSRHDFHRELDSPDKRARFMEQVNEFYFAAPRGLIQLEELPAGVGLIETRGDGVAVTRRAEQRPDNRPNHLLWVSLLRRSIQERDDEVKRQEQFAEFRSRTIGLTELRALVEKLHPRMRQDVKLEADYDAQRDRRTTAKDRARQQYETQQVVRALDRTVRRWANLPWDAEVQPGQMTEFLNLVDNVAGLRKVNEAIAALTNGRHHAEA